MLGGDIETLKEIVEIFLENTGGDMEQLQEAVKAQDVEQIRSKSHRIKGAAANIGAEEIRQTALALEQSARNAKLKNIDSQFEQLEQQWKRFNEILDGYDWHDVI